MKPPLSFKIGIISVLLVALFAVLNLTGFSKEIKNFFYLISSPIQKIFWEVGERTSNFFEGISETKNLKKENEDLKLKIQELEVEIASLKETKKENEFLRKALEIDLKKDFNLVLAEVTGEDLSGDILIINKGSRDGISKDFPVITEQKILVGKISQTYDNFSKVMLITNKESAFNGKIEERDYNPPTTSEVPAEGRRVEGGLESQPPGGDWVPIEGVVKGGGNFKLYFELLPKDKEIKEGESVITSSLGGIFPKGLLVGKIKEVKKSDVEPFQQAEILPIFDIKELKNLFIITNF